MSTRCNLDYNWHKMDDLRANPEPSRIDANVPPFGLDSDIFERDVVFLEITDCERFPLRFDASRGRIEIAIPLSLWNRLVRVGEFDTVGGQAIPEDAE